MISIKMLPSLEGVNATYAKILIAGWIQMWKENDDNRVFNLLLFSSPKSSYQNEHKVFISSNIHISDYYTININEFDINNIAKKDFHRLEYILKTTNEKSIVIIDCLTSLILFIGLSKTMWFLKKLSKQVSQVICIYKRDFVQIKIPCIETLGSTYVKIQKFSNSMINKNFNYIVEFVHRKINGGILKQQEIVNQNIISYEIQSQKLEQSKKLDSRCEKLNQIESSFRLETSENEIKQKKEIILPYIFNPNINISKINYQPEDIDDIDEEDPDDDLCF
ncbi:uncharacterized protein LOC122717888 isoform X2 [Apis laboriosa]|uniref:uncharacterized protein LOC122717888 isoform X2 n=1 Tax=Apis laboriosa TaxID=183418 RepID=UPI001CC40966|nr:uncharacterized protein LOC122717888 isoform X2 [Apis laboriosa]